MPATTPGVVVAISTSVRSSGGVVSGAGRVGYREPLPRPGVGKRRVRVRYDLSGSRCGLWRCGVSLGALPVRQRAPRERPSLRPPVPPSVSGGIRRTRAAPPQETAESRERWPLLRAACCRHCLYRWCCLLRAPGQRVCSWSPHIHEVAGGDHFVGDHVEVADGRGGEPDFEA